MRRITTVVLFFLSIAIVACGGGGSGGSSGSNHIPMGTLLVTVDDASNDSALENASISVYDDSNLIVIKGVTNVDGEFTYSLSPGSYYVKVAAQDYNPVPLPGIDAIPFEVFDGITTTESVALDVHPNAGNMGKISGTVITPDSSGVFDVLVVAEDSAQSLFASGISDSYGGYTLFNVDPGNYTLSAHRAGYRETSAHITVDVIVGGSYGGNDIEVQIHENADLSGQITFLAITNGIVDITLVHIDTQDTIPGCSTVNTGTTYLLEAVPPGTYIAWASFRNDGYVMDPDHIAKNGLPEITFAEVDQIQDFSVTGPITITDPTNAASPVVPEVVNIDEPTFTWTKYPQGKEYIIEVFDSQGNTIWGGFDATGVVQHPQIDAQKISVVFNFDGTATTLLQDGETYRWKIYTDDDAALNVQILLSSSEDKMGLFTYIQN